MPRRPKIEEAPLYVRWTPEQSSIAVEIRLDLISRMREQIAAAEKSGIESGGILVGTLPVAGSPTLRIEDVVMIARRLEDGPVFMLDPREHDRFLTTRWDAKTLGRSVVGFFRTHLRPGPLRPSLADRTLLGGQFAQQSYAVLLIEGRAPHGSALFLGSRTRLPEEPSIPEFLFHEKEFASLPQDVAEAPVAPGGASSGGKRLLWAALVTVVVAILVVLLRSAGSAGPLAISDRGLGLQVAAGPILTIGWNHSSSDLNKAISAKLIIADGKMTREVPVGADELRLGTIEYRPASKQGKITFVVNMPGSTTIEQSADWKTSSP